MVQQSGGSTVLADLAAPPASFKELRRSVGPWLAVGAFASGIPAGLIEISGVDKAFTFWQTLLLTFPLTLALVILVPTVTLWRGTGGALVWTCAAVVIGAGVVSRFLGLAGDVDVWKAVVGENCLDRPYHEWQRCLNSIDSGSTANPLIILFRAARLYWNVYKVPGLIGAVAATGITTTVLFDWLPRRRGNPALINIIHRS